MPLHMRRPNLSIDSSATLGVPLDSMRTPIPFSPMPMSDQAPPPLALTPDTPYFNQPHSQQNFSSSIPEPAWTTEEDNTIEMYLEHPPRALRTAFPPGTFPPPAALDEIVSQIIGFEAAKNTPWAHSFGATRTRLMGIARKDSMRSRGGHHRRTPSDALLQIVNGGLPPAPRGSAEEPTPRRPGLSVKAGRDPRREGSMDVMLNDAGVEQTFVETLRLSSTLQAVGAGNYRLQPQPNANLTSTEELKSPLTFSFNLTPSTGIPGKNGASTPTLGSSVGRPASLLQRGQSFTMEDLRADQVAELQALKGGSHPVSAPAANTGADTGAPGNAGEDAAIDVDMGMSPGPEGMTRSISFPESNFSASPPSSASSASLTLEPAPEDGLRVSANSSAEPEPEPFTPLHQTSFAQSALGLNLTDVTPSITFTASDPSAPSDVPSRPGTARPIRRHRRGESFGRIAEEVDPATLSLSNLRLHSPPAAARRAPMQIHSARVVQPFTTTTTTTARDGSHSSGSSASSSSDETTTTTMNPRMSREAKRQRAPGEWGSARVRPNPGLTVNVPPPRKFSGLSVGGGGGGSSDVDEQELRSPFEHKPPGSGAVPAASDVAQYQDAEGDHSWSSDE